MASDLVQRLRDAAEDSMWADHVEVSKALLRKAATRIEQLEGQRCSYAKEIGMPDHTCGDCMYDPAEIAARKTQRSQEWIDTAMRLADSYGEAMYCASALPEPDIREPACEFGEVPESEAPMVAIGHSDEAMHAYALQSIALQSIAADRAAVEERFQARMDAMRQALERIAVGDIEDPVTHAADQLVDLGYWDGDAVAKHCTAAPSPTAGAAEPPPNDLLHRLRASFPGWGDGTRSDRERLVGMAITEIERLRAALAARPAEGAQARWISVDDRLPEKFTEVLVALDGLNLPSTGQYTGNQRDQGGWCYPSENLGTAPDGRDPVVTHWMPLPATPEDEIFDCEDCGGTGRTGNVYPGSSFQPPEPESCPTCDGAGKIRAARSAAPSGDAQGEQA